MTPLGNAGHGNRNAQRGMCHKPVQPSLLGNRHVNLSSLYQQTGFLRHER